MDQNALGSEMYLGRTHGDSSVSSVKPVAKDSGRRGVTGALQLSLTIARVLQLPYQNSEDKCV